MSGSNSKHLLLTVLEAEKSKTKVPADSMSGEGQLSRVRMAAFSLCPQGVETKGSLASPHKKTNSIMRILLSGPA